MASLAPTDLAQIAQVWHAALASSTDNVPAIATLRQRLSGDLANCDVAVVCDGRCIVAFVACDREQRWLRQLFVHPARQGSRHRHPPAHPRDAGDAGRLAAHRCRQPARPRLL
jgi:hypothetical protein